MRSAMGEEVPERKVLPTLSCILYAATREPETLAKGEGLEENKVELRFVRFYFNVCSSCVF